MELGPNTNYSTVTYGNKSKAEVQGLGKVVVARDITLVNIMLVESLGYNLMSVRALNKMNSDVYFTIDMVVLLRSKTLKVMYVGYIEKLKMSCSWLTSRGQPTLKQCAYSERLTWDGCGIAAYLMST